MRQARYFLNTRNRALASPFPVMCKEHRGSLKPKSRVSRIVFITKDAHTRESVGWVLGRTLIWTEAACGLHATLIHRIHESIQRSRVLSFTPPIRRRFSHNSRTQFSLLLPECIHNQCSSCTTTQMNYFHDGELLVTQSLPPHRERERSRVTVRKNNTPEPIPVFCWVNGFFDVVIPS